MPMLVVEQTTVQFYCLTSDIAVHTLTNKNF